MYFGSEAQCVDLAASRCAAEFPDTPGLERHEYVADVAYDESTGLNEVCAARFPAFEGQ